MAEHDSHAEGHAHPGIGQYVEIGAILALLTAIEVALFFAPVPKAVVVPALLILTVLKFALVILWFMHLRFDHPSFRRMLLTGIGIAVVVFTVVLVVSG